MSVCVSGRSAGEVDSNDESLSDSEDENEEVNFALFFAVCFTLFTLLDCKSSYT